MRLFPIGHMRGWRRLITRTTEPPEEPGRLRCMYVSHAYLNKETKKNLAELSRHASVCLVTPHSARALIFRSKYEQSDTQNYRVVHPRRLGRGVSNYVLLSATCGLRTFRPHVINIEYDPWAPVFWQILILSKIWVPEARITVTVKKNTFRTGPRLLAFSKRRLAIVGLKFVDCVIAASQKTAHLYSTIFPGRVKRLVVLPHMGVDPGLFRPRTPGRQREGIAFVGRVNNRKGIPQLLDAIRGSSVMPTVSLIGPVELPGPLLESVEGAHSVGPLPNAEVAEVLGRTSVFVMPSIVEPDHEEHDARALLEAMASGNACVGTASGIIPEILAEGRGIIVPASDSAGLRGAIETLLGSNELRLEIAMSGHRHVQSQYSLETVAEGRIRLFSSIANSDLRETNDLSCKKLL